MTFLLGYWVGFWVLIAAVYWVLGKIRARENRAAVERAVEEYRRHKAEAEIAQRERLARAWKHWFGEEAR